MNAAARYAASNCEFSNSEYGVRTSGLEGISLSGNSFDDMKQIGIYITEGDFVGGDIDIVNNTINRTPYGIFCYDNPDAELKIKDNVISYVGMASPTDTMTGIFVVEITPGDASDPNTVSIHNNKIYKAPSGIHTMNLFSGWPTGTTGNVYIGENEISLLQPSPTGTAHSGILAENHTLALIIDNEVYQHNSYVSWWETAIRIGGGSIANQVYCNYTHDIGNGLWFDGNQQPLTQVALNKMKNNHRGLSLNWGKIGDQGSSGSPHDNEWLGYTWSASNPSTQVLGTNPNESDFWVQSSYPYYPTHNEIFDFSGDAIDVYTTSGSWTLGCYYSAPSFKTEETETSPVAELLGMLEATDAPQTVRERGVEWAGQYGLYTKLAMDEEMRFADEALTNFYDEKSNGSMGMLHRAVSDFQRARHASVTGQAANAENHLAALQSMETEERSEQRLAEVLRVLYANTHDLKGMDGQSESQLRHMAQLCPLDDGFGVYLARAALIKLDTLPRIYTSECEQIPAPNEDARWKDEGVADSEKTEFAVYPNPNNGRMMVSYGLSEGERGELSIYTVVGELILKRSLTTASNLMEIDLLDISSGIYLLNIQINGEHKLTERLSILKE